MAALITEYLNRNFDRHLDQLKSLVRIPSQSADSCHKPDIEKAAAWVRDQLRTIGMEHAEVLQTDGHPVVTADWLHAANQPTVLIYAHYDVQPADPLPLWTSPPFEPEVRNGRLYGRGASDDKLGVIAVLTALESLLAVEGRLPVNVKLIIEGEEEIGSPSLEPFLRGNTERFACDLVINADGVQWSLDQSQIITGLRGGASLEVRITGPSRDLHSGLHGGAVLNPLEAMARLLASLRDPDGKIAVKGFYRDVIDLSLEERAVLARTPFDEDAYRKDLGVPALHGESGYTTRERASIRPTIEINGLWGGYQGEGCKTIIPSEAHAKITCRLVAAQNPEHVFGCIRDHLESLAPAGVRVEIRPGWVSAFAWSIDQDHPANAIVGSVLKEMYGKEPFHCRCGGGIPAVPALKEVLGVQTVIFGWATPDNQFHSPDEFIHLESLQLGREGYVRLLRALADSDLGPGGDSAT